MTILIGYTPTPHGDAAFEHALEEAVFRGEDVVILNSPRSGTIVDADLIDEEADAELVRRARDHGVTARVDHAVHGHDLVSAFEALIESTGARLVVIGLRRRTAVGKLLMGSTAQRLLIELEVPVLGVKAAR
jgi:nucleotide-binding universal stress UspA family protein